ncbi:hypothetical protein [Paraburkholderia dinghuensis]|uniref:Uncharacterized protein n=1 Tax=Paraburkholderia dinghuensis TaxID=2305225 RepID=A0A3N6MC45_9BURK|nr:hypothetical protein [Paraburkholderia dinghuensis]RQH00198.1 hypothetical protein D1Y85_25515 [Paraburkholderia dinghuensis]
MEHEFVQKIRACVIYDEPRDVFIATVVATGETFEAADGDEIAAWPTVSRVEPGRVSMPRELIESPDNRANINAMLRLIWNAEIGSRVEARDWRLRSEKSDRLGQLINSPEFLDMANAAIAKAIDEFEAKGIKPAYILRERKR